MSALAITEHVDIGTSEGDTHYARCDVRTGETGVTLCGRLDRLEDGEVDEVSCTICTVAFEMHTCPVHGACRVETTCDERQARAT